jgi:Methyltransferase domain
VSSPAKTRSFALGGIGRYVQFGKRYGFPQAVRYFLNTSWFDWRTGLDTAHSVALADLDLGGAGRGDEVEYLPSWTVTVKRAFRAVRKFLGTGALAHAFVDVGAGKGKVCVVWARELRRAGLSEARVLGVDISEKLCHVADVNIAHAGLSAMAAIRQQDAADLRLDDVDRVILWLYNPFGESTVSKLLNNLQGRVEAIVYCNPVAHSVIVAAGYDVKHEEKSWHPNLSFTLYVPHPAPGSAA